MYHLAGNVPEDVTTIRMTNVDRSDHGMLALIDRIGFRHWVDQYEMTKSIGA